MPAHGLAPQNLSSDKHVDVCADSDEDRGSTPLASILIGKTASKNRQLTTRVTTRPLKYGDALDFYPKLRRQDQIQGMRLQ